MWVLCGFTVPALARPGPAPQLHPLPPPPARSRLLKSKPARGGGAEPGPAHEEAASAAMTAEKALPLGNGKAAEEARESEVLSGGGGGVCMLHTFINLFFSS